MVDYSKRKTLAGLGSLATGAAIFWQELENPDLLCDTDSVRVYERLENESGYSGEDRGYQPVSVGDTDYSVALDDVNEGTAEIEIEKILEQECEQLDENDIDYSGDGDVYSTECLEDGWAVGVTAEEGTRLLDESWGDLMLKETGEGPDGQGYVDLEITMC